jgi:hypothetical protein
MVEEREPHAGDPPAARARGGARTAAAAAVAALLLLAVGLAGGWLAARQSGPAGRGPEAGEGSEEPEAISPRTLENLGVELGTLALSDHVVARDVPGVLERVPGSRRPVYAPVAGLVRLVPVRAGDVVHAKGTVAQLVRDPFPRPRLDLTDAVLRPLNEDFHHTLTELRTAIQAFEIVHEERARLRAVLDRERASGAVPTKAELDLEYEERRATKTLENARTEARAHGLTAEEVTGLEAGTWTPPDQPPVRRILERNRLWGEEASAVLELLPASAREKPFTLAVLGELSGARLLGPDLVDAMRARPRLAAAFLDVAGLLQAGTTLQGLLALDDAGALDEVVTVGAPVDASDWDVASVEVRTGAHVEAGAVLAEVEDARVVLLRLAPTAPEVPLLERAWREGETVDARPLVPGAGPARDRVRVVRIDAGGEGASPVAAWVELPNEPLASTAGGTRGRTWALRPGTRYVARVATETRRGKFVLPAAAVVSRGPDSVVLLRSGKSFKPVPVTVEWSDARVAVVADDGGVFAGDTVALRGAYALSLALPAGRGAPAGHGHAHSHPH